MKGYYGCVFKTALKGKVALQIPLDYEFFGSGVILPPVINVQVWGMYPFEFVYNHGEEELAKSFDTTQQSISRYLKAGSNIQELITADTYSEKDIWGYSPTEKRRELMNQSKCYDCGDKCTKDFKYIDVRSEDGNLMRVAIHDACLERAIKGGKPVYPERKK